MWFPERSCQTTKEHEGKCEGAGRDLRSVRSVFLSNMSDGREERQLPYKSDFSENKQKRYQQKDGIDGRVY